MDKLYVYYSAFKLKNETPRMCCAGGKVKLQEFHPSPKPISTLVSSGISQLKHFLANIRKYNYMPTFKAQGQIYYCTESLLPLLDADHKFILLKTLVNKSINVPDSIPVLNDKLSLHYKCALYELYSITTTNDFNAYSFQCYSPLQWPSTKHRSNCYKCAD